MISTVVITTKDRQDQALNALRSVQEVNTHRELEYVVYDQSEAPGDYPGARICGPTQVAHYIDQLASFGFPKEMLEFALVGEYGGYRNVAMLDTIGEHVLSTDDDTLCVFVEPPNKEPGFRSGDPQPMYVPFKNRADWQSQFETASVDLLSVHEGILGNTTKDGFKVRLAVPGFIGDAAADTEHINLTKPAQYASMRGAREVLQAVPKLTVSQPKSSGPWLRTIQYSFDNTSMLPPFPPNGRGECTIFGKLLAHLKTELIAYLPWAVLHVPPEGRQFMPLPKFNIAMLLGALIGNTPKPLAQTGAELMQFGIMAPEQTMAVVHSLHENSTENFQKHLEGLLPMFHDKVDPIWAKDVRAYIKAASKPVTFTTEQIDNWVKQAQMYGALLTNWADIYDCARRLRRQGVRISIQP